MRRWLLAISVAVGLWLGIVSSASAQSDTTPPVIVDVTIEPLFVDTTASDQTITITVHITDDLTGLWQAWLTFGPRVMDRDQERTLAFGIYCGNLVTGTVTDGIYVALLKIPRYSASGRWVAKRAVGGDAVGNQMDCQVNGQMECPSDWGSVYFINVQDDSSMYLPMVKRR